MKKIKVMLLLNDWVGWQIAKYFKERKDDIVALALNEEKNQSYVKQIIRTLKLNNDFIFRKKPLDDIENLTKIKKINPDLIISAYYSRILKIDVIKIPRLGCINIHPGYLPFNRGKQPHIWPIIDSTPAGASIHYINKGIDTGDIIARKKVKVLTIDTGISLYIKTAMESVKLFKKTYPKIIKGTIKPIQQEKKLATMHLVKDAEKIRRIDLNKRYKAKDLINIFRAFTITDQDLAYIQDKSSKVGISIKLRYFK